MVYEFSTPGTMAIGSNLVRNSLNDFEPQERIMDIPYSQLKDELGNKERNIHQLAEYINNRTDNTPNYSLLLGAGCSITSGIRPAGALINEWKKEIFQTNFGNYDLSYEDQQNEIETYFSSQDVLSWYDQRNEYSCLFEHKYNLQRQRRVFVEREVSGKSPSLGYAYLIQLVKECYFNTLFTTNFDDLLNEAFYQFSDNRPIVCAHDSAISSITVTAQRPKIIKLHGDYLFDDIKSTMRETESLEENTKSKFKEFAKDFGLIVIGYAGNDRSVMDVISNLLKHEHYFKHGIYWCLRSDSQINPELRKLFWKEEKVFFVNIDGFDELMANLNDRLNKGKLPIDTHQSSNKAMSIVTDLTNNELVKNSNCKVVQRDLKLLNSRSKIDALEVAMNVISEDKFFGKKNSENDDDFPSKTKLSRKNKVDLHKISVMRKAREHTDALKIVNSELKNEDNTEAYKKELYLQQASIYVDIGDKNETIKAFKKQAELSSRSVVPLLNIAHFSETIEEKLKYVNKALAVDEHDHRVYAEKALALSREFIRVDKDTAKAIEEELIKTLNKGIQIHPVIGNMCYRTKFDHYFSILSHHDKENYFEKCEEIVSELEAQDPYAPSVAQLRYNLLMYMCENPGGVGFTDTGDVLSYIRSNKSRAISSYLPKYEILELKYYSAICDKDEVSSLIDRFEKEYSVTSQYLTEKSYALLSTCRDLDGAIEALEEAINKYDDNSLKDRLAILYVYKKDFSKAKKLVDEVAEFDNKLLERYYHKTGDYEKALSLNIDKCENYPHDHGSLIERSFYLLKLKKYKEAYELLNNQSNVDLQFKIPLTVNYELARVGKGKQVRQKSINDLRNNDHKTLQQAALACLAGEYTTALDILEHCVSCDYEDRFTIEDWLVFEQLEGNHRYQKILGAE